MKTCKFCNQENASDAITCTNCGANIETQNIVKPEKKPSVLLKILSFFVPIVGIILFFLNRKTDKRAAKSYGKMALISIVISVVFSIVFFVVGMVTIQSAVGPADDTPNDGGYLDVVDDIDDEFSIDIDNGDGDVSIDLGNVEDYNADNSVEDDFNIPAIGE